MPAQIGAPIQQKMNRDYNVHATILGTGAVTALSCYYFNEPLLSRCCAVNTIMGLSFIEFTKLPFENKLQCIKATGSTLLFGAVPIAAINLNAALQYGCCVASSTCCCALAVNIAATQKTKEK
jgi:hypothetical protein